MENTLFTRNIMISRLILNGLHSEAEELISDLNYGELKEIYEASTRFKSNPLTPRTHKNCMEVKIKLIEKYLNAMETSETKMSKELFSQNITISQLILNGLFDEAEELLSQLTKPELNEIFESSISFRSNRLTPPIHKNCMKVKIKLIRKYLLKD